jgi:hypothetical protein
MSDSYAVVVTTINHPTRALIDIAASSPRLGARFVLIGDQKSPPNFELAGADYLDLEAQTRTRFRFAEIAPIKHYARKNVGYLVAMRGGANVIIETDDDNIPIEGFWAPRRRRVDARKLDRAGWTNVYRYFSDALIWPRGLPLDKVSQAPPALDGAPLEDVDCPIQQGLADGNPDVDAIYRLILPLPQNFDRSEPVALGEGSWCPFNSQNTTWWRDAFPLLYLPSYCSFRMTDIWRSFVAQKIAWLNGWRVLFHSSTVFQERNEHSLMRDFAEEVPGYLNNDAISQVLEGLPLQSGVSAISANLRLCYQALVQAGWVGPEELPLLEAWIADIETLV